MSDVINKVSVNGTVYDIADEESRTKLKELIDNLSQMIADELNEYLKEHPIEGEVSQEDIEQAVLDYMSVNSGKFVGATPHFEIGTVETLESGSSVIVEITGTDENPILNFGIPKGADGTITDEQIATAVDNYLTENPPSGTVDAEEIKVAVTEYLTENPPSGVSEEDIENAVNAYMEANADSFKGENGVTPNLTIGTVETLASGSSATATITGTIEEPVLNLGIPQGAKGEEGGGATTPVEVEGETVTIPSSSSSSGGSTYVDPLDGKKILFIGDSICEGVGANGQPYPYWIKQWHETATVYNLGVGGMTIAQKDESITNSMPVRIASGEFENTDYANPDIIVFEGGINDFMNNVSHGYIQSSYDVNKYVTFCQGVEYMFNYFKTLFPKARMIFVSTHHVTAYDRNKARSWWGAVSEICAKWGVEFLDIFSLICTAKIDGLQLHPDYTVHRDYYAPFINKALVSETPLSGALTTNYYSHNAPCFLYLHSGTKSFSLNETVSTSDWRVNLVRCNGVYEGVTAKCSIDLSDVDNTTEGTYKAHIAYSENGITLACDATITIAGESAEKTLDSITATKTNTTYNVGNEVGTDDITVTATYTDGSTSDITSSATFDTSNINNAEAGEYNISVSYTENEVTVTTTIQIKIVESGATTVVASGTAKDVYNNETVTWSLDSEGVITFDTTSNNVIIATYNSGERPWYDYITDIKKAVFSSHITNTGGNVLLGATALTEVDLQADSVIIGASAFKGCTALATIDLTKASSILSNGFANCTSLPNEIVLGATSLATSSFYYQSQITSIKFTGTPSSIASDAFSNITGWSSSANLKNIYVPWSEGEVANAPWGAGSATINYDYTE